MLRIFFQCAFCVHFTFAVCKSVCYALEYIVAHSKPIDIFITFADMKNIVYLLLAFLLLNFCSCKKNSYPHSLLRADSLASVNPDSAVSLLKSIKDDMASRPEEVRMYYQLLCVKAKDKAYIALTSDSLIFQVLRYYIDKKDNRHLPEAYFYAGRVCRELGDAPRALNYFYNALGILNALGNSFCETRFRSLICNQSGALLSNQGIYDEAAKMFRQAYQYSKLCEDSVSMLYDLRDIASTYSDAEILDSALYFYHKSYEVASGMQNNRMMGMVQSQVASLYLKIGDYDSARKSLQVALDVVDDRMRSGVYSIAGELYHKIGNKDSAAYYYNEILDCGTIYAKADAYWHLAEYALEESKPRMAMEYLGKYVESIDSVWTLTDTETVRKMKSLYDYTLQENENNQLKAENARKQIYLTGTVLGIVFIASCFFIYYMYSKTKRLKLEMQLMKLKRIEEEQYQKSRRFVEENKKEQEEMEQKLQATAPNEASLKEKLLKMKEKLYHTGQKAELEIKIGEYRRKQLLDTDIYKYFENLYHDDDVLQISSEKWISLEEAVNEAYQGFTETLFSIHKLSKHELRVCLLIKIGIPPKGMANLTNHSKESVASTRRRMYKKFFGRNGTPQQWDEFINSL